MNAGDLTKRVSIYKPLPISDNQGGRSQIWVEHCKAWAQFKRPRFASTVIQGAPATVITQGILIREVAGISRGWQIRYKERIFEIVHVDESVLFEQMLTTREVEK